jgi:hypothetical protein
MVEPTAIRFPDGVNEDFDDNTLELLEASIWSYFDEKIQELILCSDKMFYFLNIFDTVPNKKSIYIEYMWLRDNDTIDIVGYRIFDSDNIPDKVLDRLNDFKNNKFDVTKHEFNWG